MSATHVQHAFDQAKAEAFAGRVLGALNDGALCLMLSVGHRTGLFDVLSALTAATSDEIAARASLNERYVREWLGAMATAGVVGVDPTSSRFSLAPEHAACLTRAAAADNMAVFAQYVAVLGRVEDEIVTCFEQGGGVPYEKYPRFQAVMAEDSGQSVLSSLESHVLSLVPGLTDRLSTGARVLDIGCGSGRIANRLAELYPNSRCRTTGTWSGSEVPCARWTPQNVVKSLPRRWRFSRLTIYGMPKRSTSMHVLSAVPTLRELGQDPAGVPEGRQVDRLGVCTRRGAALRGGPSRHGRRRQPSRDRPGRDRARAAGDIGPPRLEGLVLRYGQLHGPGTWNAEAVGNVPVHVAAAAHAAALAVVRGEPGAYNIVEDGGATSNAKARAALGWDSGLR